MKKERNKKGQFVSTKKETGETLLKEIHGSKPWAFWPSNTDYKSASDIKTLIKAYQDRINYMINLFSKIKKAELIFCYTVSCHKNWNQGTEILVNVPNGTIKIYLPFCESEGEYIASLNKNLKELENHLDLLQKEL